jgi:rRNA maturation RNase YbeY
MTERINFFTEGTTYRLKEKRKAKAWILTVIRKENHIPGDINIILCDDDYLSWLNEMYLGRDTLTDVISFDLAEEDEMIAGDVFISIDRVKENAIKYKTDILTEASRVIIHGILHLAGYEDHSRKEKEVMRQKEDYYLKKRF